MPAEYASRLNIGCVREQFTRSELQIAQEIEGLFSAVHYIAVEKLVVHRAALRAPDTVSVALVQVECRQRAVPRELGNWLRVRTYWERLQLVVLQ